MIGDYDDDQEYDDQDAWDYDLDDEREPDEPDWGYEAWLEESEQHREQCHEGGDCDCPPPPEPPVAAQEPAADYAVYSDEPPF